MFKHLVIIVAMLGFSACTSEQLNQTLTTSSSLLKHADIIPGTSLTNQQITEGVKQALTLGVMNVAKGLGKEGGFYNNSQIKIPLPQNLQTAKNMLTLAGYGSLVEDVELKMNQAAEASMPIAKDTFLAAIKDMSMTDALSIVKGNKTAATEYFYKKMSPSLTENITPIVKSKLNEVNALSAYNNLLEQYKNLPLLSSFAPDVQNDLVEQTVSYTLKGAFTYLAKEEEIIRENPAARTTALLQKVFALQSN